MAIAPYTWLKKKLSSAWIRFKTWWSWFTFRAPETEKYWTTLYFGSRGSGKTLHQAKMVLKLFKYFDKLYARYPELKKSIIFSVQKFSPDIEKKYLNQYLYYWTDATDLQYCPRRHCWRGTYKHRLHGAYVIFDDMATIMPADSWADTPVWLRKTFAQARHFGIRILANCQDPFSIDINFRRYVDMGFRFRKLLGSIDPDETKPPVNYIWGLYQRRRIEADLLWNQGNKSEDEIKLQLLTQEKINEINETNLFKDSWRATYHLITRKVCNIYDTTQDVPEYHPVGFKHLEYKCIDPEHPNCGYVKKVHELV